ncbi:Arm DNA-binding domain-containing protein [Methylobacterium sp. J-090]|nr:Arm DNA-binding domain-containing protein [Methylobacterium sp. J-090]
MPPGPKPAFWDDSLPGFGVKLNPGGSRQWGTQYRTLDGRTPRTTIDRVNTISLDDARKLARTILAKAQTGHDPQAEKAAAEKQASITLGSVADAYLKRAKTRLQPQSYEETERHLLKDWKPLADRPLTSIKRADVADGRSVPLPRLPRDRPRVEGL